MFLAETSIQLVPDGTLLLHLLLVVVMVAVVNRTLLRPINKILEDRDKHILGRVDQAKEMLKTREEHLAAYASALKQARSEGYQLLERERAQAVKEKDDKVRAFKEESARRLSEELKTTLEQEQKLQGELEGQAEQLSSMITAQILRR
jgi:F-type H+-transporting ATPase subunit b